MKVYILEYDLSFVGGDEHQVDYYGESDRQRWLDEYHLKKTKYYSKNLKAYACADVPEITEQQMNELKGGL